MIESAYQPSGNIPNDESYNQLPIKINGNEYFIDVSLVERPYPLVPTLDEISLERQLEAEKQGAEQEEIDPELQPKTLEDKCRVWFGEDMPTKYDDQRPERDLVNHPRIEPQILDQPPTRLYFLPASWFTFFESKTGRTGGYAFATTFGTFLVSKEIFCYNDNAHIGLSLSVLAFIGIKFYGKKANEYLTASVIVSFSP